MALRALYLALDFGGGAGTVARAGLATKWDAPFFPRAGPEAAAAFAGMGCAAPRRCAGAEVANAAANACVAPDCSAAYYWAELDQVW